MFSLTEAQAAILTRITPAAQTESVALRAARGRYLASELRARADHPPFDNSSMDGYALDCAELVAADFVLPVHGESHCGGTPGRLKPGSAMRIFTGAPLPAGADAVVIQEDVMPVDGRLCFPHSVQPGANIRRRGEDFAAGTALQAPGRRLTSFDLALLSAAGIAHAPVFVRARALVVATGDELIAPGAPLAPGQVYESNRLATLMLLEELGVAAEDGGVVGDDPRALRALLAAAGDYDFVITSGGASVGDHDLVKQVFAEIGEIHFWKARIKPGKPIAFGRSGTRTHFFALPGNPVSSLVTFKLFVEPAVVAWNHGHWRLPELPATAANDFRRRPGRTEFLRARLQLEDGRLLAQALPGQCSHMLLALRETNGFIRLDEDSAGFRAGERVFAVPLRLEL